MVGHWRDSVWNAQSDVSQIKISTENQEKRITTLEIQNAEKQKDLEYIKKGIDEIKAELQKERHK